LRGVKRKMLPEGVFFNSPGVTQPNYEPKVRVPWAYNKSRAYVLKTDSLAHYFRRILDSGNDFKATVYGPNNIGKSESIIELCRQICPEFKLEEDVVFTLEDFYDVMENGQAKRWRVKILDDFGSELDPSEGMFDPAKHCKHYFETSRTFATGYFITTPNKKYINKDTRDRIADYFIELKIKNSSAKYVTGVVHWIQQNNRLSKLYNHSLCLGSNGLINNKDQGPKFLGWVFYPPPKEIHEAYVPLRIAKGRKNLDAGLADFKSISGPQKTVDEIVAEVWANKAEYTKFTAGGKLIWRKPKIAADNKIGGVKCSQVIERLNDLLPEE
jgi:hypothetical protein